MGEVHKCNHEPDVRPKRRLAKGARFVGALAYIGALMARRFGHACDPACNGQDFGEMGNSIKKSELIRAGIKALAAMSDANFLKALLAVPAIKTGRPAKD